jgi:hypothetical protein
LDTAHVEALREEFRIFAERYMHFTNLWTVYNDLLSGHYIPTVNFSSEREWTTDVRATLMFVLYAYFYSLVEDDHNSVNGFRIWRARYPEEETAIAAVESRVAPFRDDLKLFRNRLGFHGSRSRSHEAKALEVFSRHSGTEILNAMKDFKSLGAALFAKSNIAQGIGKYTADQVRSWIDSIVDQPGQD